MRTCHVLFHNEWTWMVAVRREDITSARMSCPGVLSGREVLASDQARLLWPHGVHGGSGGDRACGYSDLVGCIRSTPDQYRGSRTRERDTERAEFGGAATQRSKGWHQGFTRVLMEAVGQRDGEILK